MTNSPSIIGNSFPEFRRRRNNPIQTMLDMQREMDQLFESFFGTPLNSTAALRSQSELEDAGSHYLMNFEMPGLSKDDVKIEVLDGAVHVSGERKEESKGKEGAREKSYSSYDRWLSIPQNAKSDDIEAHMENGVLRIAIPKAEESKAKKIQIGEGKSGFFSRLLERKGSNSEKSEKKESAA